MHWKIRLQTIYRFSLNLISFVFLPLSDVVVVQHGGCARFVAQSTRFDSGSLVCSFQTRASTVVFIHEWLHGRTTQIRRGGFRAMRRTS